MQFCETKTTVPSPATAGRTRVSINSLMVSTTSVSAALKNSSALAAAAPVSTGAPERKNSVTTPSTAGRKCCHSPSDLVTEMKSPEKKTPLTPSMENSACASGERAAAEALGMSSTPSCMTERPGRNFRVAGLGVDSV